MFTDISPTGRVIRTSPQRMEYSFGPRARAMMTEGDFLIATDYSGLERRIAALAPTIRPQLQEDMERTYFDR